MLQMTLRQCQFKDLDAIYVLAQSLAHYFPKPEQFAIAIYELLLNAIEHGNLGIGFATKTELIRHGTWKQEVMRRLALPENQTKEVRVALNYDAQVCTLTIIDSGSGFPWAEYVGREVAGRAPNGRGLWIAFHTNFDSITFNEAGNEVTCTAHYAHWPVPVEAPVTPHRQPVGF